MKICVQGESGGRGQQAAYKFFSNEVRVMPCQAFTDVFDAVNDDTANFGVVPVENSTTGTIAQVYDLLLEHDLHVVGEIYEKATRFFVISRETAYNNSTAEANKISLAFATRSNPGALYKCLGEFADRGINLSKIESRLRPNRPWECVFYLDFEGNLNNDVSVQAVTGLLRHAAFVKILGSYRAAE